MQAFCPRCDDQTIVDKRGACPFCDTPLLGVPRQPGPRGPAARLIRESLVQDARRLYYDERLSMRQVAARIHPHTEYASVASCAQSLYDQFKVRGWRLRDQRAVTAERNRRHGHARRGQRDGYRRWLREQRDDYQPQCSGTVKNGPRKGQQCQLRSVTGEAYCQAHHPDRQQRLDEMCAGMRLRVDQNARHQRIERAAELRAQGLTYRQIAGQLGYADHTGAWAAVNKHAGIAA